MSRVAPEVWMRLAGERAQGEALWARLAMPGVTMRLMAALDAGGVRHLLVPVGAEEHDIRDVQSRGISVVTRELSIAGHEVGRYLDVACRDATGHEAFDVIGGEIAERLATGSESASEVVARVLAKWRRFWGMSIRRVLSREEQLGLFGELWFFSVWLLPRVGEDQALARWRGPSGARHDFEWAGRSVEAKTTTSTRGLVHHIHGLEQLSPPENGSLLFFSLHVREESGATNTLPTLIARCRDQLKDNADNLSRLEAALAETGYLSVDDDEYSKLHLRVIEEGLFEVRDNFPRITPAHIAGSVPPGVEAVEYDINLGGFDHLCVARHPSDSACAHLLS